MTSIVLLTGTELRHQFMRRYLAIPDRIQILRTYCEGEQRSLQNIVAETNPDPHDIRLAHLAARTASEEDFFQLFVDNINSEDSNPYYIPKGDINKKEHQQAIINLNPDLIVAYGCSIIREPLVSAFENRFLNLHLGLSPYYRGSGTNFWPLVNKEPEYVGATFMYLDKGIDTGNIIHQIQARFYPGDTPSQIGNRLIKDAAGVYCRIILFYDRLERMPQPPKKPKGAKYYKAKDYSTEATHQLYQNFRDYMIEDHIENPKKIKLVRNKAL